MEQIKEKRVSYIFNIILAFLMMFSMCFSFTSFKANAEETITPAQNIINNTMFLTWRKGQDEGRGKFIYCNLYVPDSVYSADFTYNAMSCPKRFLVNNNIQDNYYEKLEALGEPILKYNNMNAQKTPNGRIYKFGVTNIPQRGEVMDIAFIFYLMDSANTKTYLEPLIANYSKITDRNYSDKELEKMVDQKIGMTTNFEGIVLKIQELVNSIWKYIVMGLGAIIIVWGAYIGIKIIIAKKNDDKINARDMVKNLIVGIVIMFVIALGLPLLINGLSYWIK